MKIDLRAELCRSLIVSESQLNRLILRAPHTYKVYTIPKRTGGLRTIAQPAKETKYLQYWLIENIFKRLPIHECATAYKYGTSIKGNASAHQHNCFIAKFDFKNYFTSIKASDLISHMAIHLIGSLTPQDIVDIARIACIKPEGAGELCLSIGAPSSPILSNTIMYEFDREVFDWCSKNDITYTRYADDLTFSTSSKGISSSIEPAIRKIVRKLEYPRLTFNTKKTTHLSKAHQRRVTGLIITNQGAVSLGRARKRMISALIHRFTLQHLSDDEICNLQGLLGFAYDVEPSFILRMRDKYGPELISHILQVRKKPTPSA